MVLGTDTRYLGHSAWYITSTLLNREPEHTAPTGALCLLLCLRLSKQRSACEAGGCAASGCATLSLSLSFLSFSLLGLYLTCTSHLLLDTQRTILPQGVCVLSCARTRCILVLSTCCMHPDQSTSHPEYLHTTLQRVCAVLVRTAYSTTHVLTCMYPDVHTWGCILHDTYCTVLSTWYLDACHLPCVVITVRRPSAALNTRNTYSLTTRYPA